MRLSHVHLCGFRGYRKPLQIEFAEKFTIIDGRNGVGKSTIFDAVEYVLTGTVSKYDSAKASGETVSDYMWWVGEGPAPTDRYVEAGFCDEGELIVLRRTPFKEPSSDHLLHVTSKLVDSGLAPTNPLKQLCASSIIRDEHIAGLSLDLKETDRYALLRDALGANDADDWIKRASDVLALTKRKTASAQLEVTASNSEFASTARRIDEIRASLIGESTIAGAVERLRSFSKTDAAPDRLSGPVRDQIAAFLSAINTLEALVSQWENIATERQHLEHLAKDVETSTTQLALAEHGLLQIPVAGLKTGSSILASQARSLIELVSLGKAIGLQEGSCPLCATSQSHEQFERGLSIAEQIARRLDDEAAGEAEREQARHKAESEIVRTRQKLDAATAALESAVSRIAAFDETLNAIGLLSNVTVDAVRAKSEQARYELEQAQKDLRVLDTIRLSSELERAQKAEAEAKSRLAKAQDRLGRSQRAEGIAQALFDAARRAAAETLDVRLDRVLPLMSELYQRLRPHPFWKDIQYTIRGDVRRFLKLQVGEDLNPQFIFSSGQRRATGLAFLLSINLSLAWSRWRSILLDDPVQHIDDFRTLHLAEVTAQLVADGRQIICAVEDAALADLLCRRLPIKSLGEAKRVTLGVDDEGNLGKLGERSLAPTMRNALMPDVSRSVAG